MVRPTSPFKPAPSAGERASRGFNTLISIKKAVLAKKAVWKPSERLVAIAVADRFGEQEDGTLSAFMTVRDLTQRTGLSDRTVRRALKSLCEPPRRLFRRSLGVERRGRRLPIYRYALEREGLGSGEGT